MAELVQPDSTGFYGLTTYTPLMFRGVHDAHFAPQGLTERVDGEAVVMTSAVVMLDCTGQEEQAESGRVLHHCPVKVADATATEGAIYLLPPLTLLTVISVDEHGFEYLPGRFMLQKRITVRPTFRIEQGLMSVKVYTVHCTIHCTHCTLYSLCTVLAIHCTHRTLCSLYTT
jgi:hypothetical protein